MPSVTISHLYTFVAMIAVSSILIFSFMAYANGWRLTSETMQLKNQMSFVAGKCTELITLALSTNASSQTSLQVLQKIGDKQYWLQLHSLSGKAWLDGGLGDIPLEQGDWQVFLPREANASGYYISESGAASIRCNFVNGIPEIELSCLGKGD